MALLTLDERKAIFKELGLGEYNKTNIKAFQKKYLLRKSDYDGIYGTNTDNALRTVYYTKVYTKNFKPTEFRCECGGKYCCGYPTYMKPAELIHIQKIRDHYGKPITITCGMRCKTYNSKLGGSVQNSLHLKGQALDFYQSGVTDTLAHRKPAIKWIKKQSNHHYTYGNGINSNGYSVNAPYMGNALHTDTYDNIKPKHPVVKGANTQEAQKNPSASVQKPSATTSKAYTPSASYKGKLPTKTIKLGDSGEDVKRLQTFLNWAVGCHLNGKGYFRDATDKYLKEWQKKQGLEANGIFGAESRKKAKAMVEKYNGLSVRILDACKEQTKWMKNAKYGKWSPCTIKHSKEYGTCVTYVACALQRLGYLKSGQYIWHNGKGYGTGKVRGTNDKMSVIYMHNKTLTSLKDKLRAGDVILLDDNKSGVKGSGGHIFILTGKWTKKGNPYIWDQEPSEKCIKTQKARAYSGSRKVLAVVRLKENVK